MFTPRHASFLFAFSAISFNVQSFSSLSKKFSSSDGYALDIVVIRSKIDNAENGAINYQSTPWKATFNANNHRSDSVQVTCNGNVLASKAEVFNDGQFKFDNVNETPSMDDLALCFGNTNSETKDAVFDVTYVLQGKKRMQFIKCQVFLWDAEDSVVVVDVDGTLTPSILTGQFKTLFRNDLSYLHDGACDFFTKVNSIGNRIVYVSARPIKFINRSRKFLKLSNQDGIHLPHGPLITNHRGIRAATMTEVIKKDAYVLKTKIISGIKDAMINSGRNTILPIFTAGFGDMPGDEIAYQSVGISNDSIFTINPKSELKSFAEKEIIYESYADPALLISWLPKLMENMPQKYADKIIEVYVEAKEIESTKRSNDFPNLKKRK